MFRFRRYPTFRLLRSVPYCSLGKLPEIDHQHPSLSKPLQHEPSYFGFVLGGIRAKLLASFLNISGFRRDFLVVGYNNGDNVPAKVDWRDKNVLLPVKNQGNCGSCYAFSAVGAVEALHAIRRGQLIALSEQEIVDCDPHNDGCMGGFIEEALQYIIENGGISTEDDYPYTEVRGKCDATQ